MRLSNEGPQASQHGLWTALSQFPVAQSGNKTLSPREKEEGCTPFPVHRTKTSGVADRKKDTTSDSTHVAGRAQLGDPGDRQLSNYSLGKLPKVYL